MITIIMKRHGKQVEVDMPVMYEELQLALWKLGLDRESEKYTLAELNVSYRFQMPYESLILRLLEGNMTLLVAIAAIFSFIAPPNSIREMIHLATFAGSLILTYRPRRSGLLKVIMAPTIYPELWLDLKSVHILFCIFWLAGNSLLYSFMIK